MTLLRLHNSVEYVSRANGIQLWSLITGRQFLLHGDPNKLIKLFHALQDGVPMTDAVNELSRMTRFDTTSIESLLDKLRRLGAILEVPLSDETFTQKDELYNRQIGFFNFFERDGLSGETLNQNLQNRRIVIIGIGGIGSWITLLCSRIGIRNIVGIDPDCVQCSNLSRQILYAPNDIGTPKVSAAERKFREETPDVYFEGHPVRIQCPSDLLPFIQEADLVFNPFEWAIADARRETIAIACGEAGVPSLAINGGCIGPLCVPGYTSCIKCHLQRDHNFQQSLSLMQEGQNREKGRCVRRFPFAPFIGVIASIAVWEVVRFLSKCDRPPTLDGVLCVNAFDYKVEFLKVPRLSDCSLCSQWGHK